MVKLPDAGFRFDADMLKLVDEPGVPDVVAVSVVVPPGTDIVGCTTLNVVDGPDAGAVLPARSDAVPAAIEIPNVPVPVMPEMVTVRVVPEPETPMVPDAPPVEFSVILPVASVLELKLASE